MFNTGFQSSSAIAKNMEYCVGSLTANPDFLEELRKELDGKVSRQGLFSGALWMTNVFVSLFRLYVCVCVCVCVCERERERESVCVLVS